MNKQIFTGLKIWLGFTSMAFIGTQLRVNNNNFYVKEVGAALEVIGHSISFAFTGDTMIDEWKHIIDSEIIIRSNIPNSYGIFYTLPNSQLINDLEEFSLTPLAMNNTIINSYVPFIIGSVVIAVQKFMPYIPNRISPYNEQNTFFDLWKDFASLPDKFPGIKIIGLLSAGIYQGKNLPFIGEYLDQLTGGMLNDLAEWSEHPGGNTVIGQFYRNNIIEPWEQIHTLHHTLEEFEIIQQSLRGEIDSPIMYGVIEVINSW